MFVLMTPVGGKKWFLLRTIFSILQVNELLIFCSMKLCLSWWPKTGSSERELARSVSRSHVTRVTWPHARCVSHVLESRARVRLSLRTPAIRTTHMWRGYRPNISVVMLLPSFDPTNSLVKTSISRAMSRTLEIDDNVGRKVYLIFISLIMYVVWL